MAITIRTIKALLESDEPDYAAGKKLGKAALPLLKKLASQKILCWRARPFAWQE